MNKIILSTMIILGLVIQSNLFFGDSSLTSLSSLKNNLNTIRESNRQLALRNQLLAKKVIKLQKDNEIIEGIAREYLGMINSNEHLVIMRNKY